MRGSLLLIPLLAAALLVPGSTALEAQTQPRIPAPRQVPFGPALAQLRSAPILGPLALEPESASAVRRLMGPGPAPLDGKRQGRVLMIVGGAGIVAGLLLDEGIITVAGAGVAGFGLYLYLR